VLLKPGVTGTGPCCGPPPTGGYRRPARITTSVGAAAPAAAPMAVQHFGSGAGGGKRSGGRLPRLIAEHGLHQQAAAHRALEPQERRHRLPAGGRAAPAPSGRRDIAALACGSADPCSQLPNCWARVCNAPALFGWGAEVCGGRSERGRPRGGWVRQSGDARGNLWSERPCAFSCAARGLHLSLALDECVGAGPYRPRRRQERVQGPCL